MSSKQPTRNARNACAPWRTTRNAPRPSAGARGRMMIGSRGKHRRRRLEKREHDEKPTRNTSRKAHRANRRSGARGTRGRGSVRLPAYCGAPRGARRGRCERLVPACRPAKTGSGRGPGNATAPRKAQPPGAPTAVADVGVVYLEALTDLKAVVVRQGEHTR